MEEPYDHKVCCEMVSPHNIGSSTQNVTATKSRTMSKTIYVREKSMRPQQPIKMYKQLNILLQERTHQVVFHYLMVNPEIIMYLELYRLKMF